MRSIGQKEGPRFRPCVNLGRPVQKAFLKSICANHAICLTTLRLFVVVVDKIVNGGAKMEEKTSEVADK